MNAATGFGTVVLAGRTFQILDLRLMDGVINVEFHVEGPTPLLKGYATVFGEDGRGVWQFSEQVIPPVSADHCVPVRMTLRVGSVVPEAASLPAC